MTARDLIPRTPRCVLAAALALLAGACALAPPLVLSSCGPTEPAPRPPLEPGPAPDAPAPPRGRGVQTIRVLLNAKPVRSALLASSGGFRLLADRRVVLESAAPLGVTEVRRRGPMWQWGARQFVADELVLEGVGQSFLQFGRTMYRGTLRLAPAGATDLDVVNHVRLEAYLAGVLPRELFRSWALETYRALAITARTFAMYHMARGGPGDHDVGAGTASQVYGGLTAETDKSRQAVQSTWGQILVYGPDGREEILLTQYSSCCGGVVNPAAVLYDAEDIPPLRGGQICQDCQASPRFHWPPVRIGKAALFRALQGKYSRAASLGGVSAVRVTQETDHGRPVWVDVIGTQPGQRLHIRAEGIRLALIKAGLARGVFSMNCRLRDLGAQIELYDGRGYGHGVGLCQYGAQGKALQGWSAEQILSFYYPGAKIGQAY